MSLRLIPRSSGVRRAAALGLSLFLSWCITAPVRAAEGDAPASGEPLTDPTEWLRAMDRAFSELNYDGVFSYYTGADLTTLRVVHMTIDGVTRERLVHLNGAPREILREGEDVSCIVMPGDDLLELESSIPTGPFARAFVRRFDQLSGVYGLSFVGYGRVADRRAVRLKVSPKDEDRFGYRLWLDEATRMLLRSELVDQRGQRLEIFQFNQLRLGADVSPDALASSLDLDGPERRMVSHLSLESQTPKPVETPAMNWSLGWVPRGFTMAAADVRRKPSTLKDVSTMMYSDGLAAFSVYIEALPPAGAGNLVSRNGATVAVTHLASNAEPHLITVVGELPTATAQKIAQAVSPR